MESDEGMAAKDEQRVERGGRKRIENWTVNLYNRFHLGVVN